MFGYLLSVAVAFIVFGTVVNIVKNFSKVLNNLSELSLWFGVTAFSVHLVRHNPNCCNTSHFIFA